MVVKVLKKIKSHSQHDGYRYTRQIQYSPSFINRHIVCLPWVTHPTVTLQEEVTALPVAVGVWGFINDFKDRLPRGKTVHSLLLINFIWTVAMEEFPYCQRSSTVRHSFVQDLHRYENSPGIRGYLANGQTQVLEKFSLQRVQGEPKASLECLFVHPYVVHPVIVAFF